MFLIAVCEVMSNVHIATSLGVRSRSLRKYMQIVSNTKQIPYLEVLPLSDYSRCLVVIAMSKQ